MDLIGLISKTNKATTYIDVGCKGLITPKMEVSLNKKNNFNFYLALIMIILFCGCTSSPDNSNISVDHENTAVLPTIDELDSAIRAATDNLNERVHHGQVIAIISITSNHISLSEYIISELNSYIISDNLFFLVDRHQLDAIRMEQNFQLSGEVDDESAQSIGRILGAQAIIIGTISQL